MKKNVEEFFKHKKIAIVHDAIVGYGGGEKILALLNQLFPQAEIFSSVVFEKNDRLQINTSIRTSFLQYFPAIKRKPIIIQLFSFFVWRSFNLRSYDIVLTLGGFYLSQMVEMQRNPNTFHIHYCISHPFNLFMKTYTNMGHSILNHTVYPVIRAKLKKTMRTIPLIWADSKYLQIFIKTNYKRESTLVYPPVEMIKTKLQKTSQRIFYCYIARLSSEKRVDIIIQAFNKNGLPLVIIGTGKLEEKLKKLAHDNITFTGYLPTDEYTKILTYVKAFVHVNPDDPLPMAPIEALSMGIPVIGYYGAGLREIIIEGKTGVFFHKFTPESLNEAIQKFQTMSFNKHTCRLHAMKFSKERFLNTFPNMVLSAYEKYQKTKDRYRS